jgi:hypothetical protein
MINTEFVNWLGEKVLTENASRYSIEVNFRTSWGEAKDHFIKLVLGYVMAALKQHQYHVKHVYTVKPFRILISTKQWDDGSWVGCLSYNNDHDSFMFSEGVYNKQRGTCTVIKTEKVTGESASDLSKEVAKKMMDLKHRHPYDGHKLNPVKQKRGPKK